MSDRDPLCIVCLTPAGAGAIATLRVEGNGALDAVAVAFRLRSGMSLHNSPVDQPTLGLFGPEPGEPIVVHRRRDGAVELHCHGGTAAVQRIAHLLAQAGARIVSWQDWMRTHAPDPIAADARLAMANARTERTAAILLDQYGGAWARAMAEIEQLISAGENESARRRVQTLLARADLGRHLTTPWRIVLAGRPNVGKSSLMNAMLGYERAIVHTTAGTTRDVLTAATAIDGWPVELIDTAGLAPPGPEQDDQILLNRGIALGEQQMAEADLLVLVCDSALPLSDQETTWLQQWPRALQVDNKSDLPAAAGERTPAIRTSALLGDGLSELLEAIARRLVPSVPLPGAAVPFTVQQSSRLQTLLDSLPGRA